MSAPTAASAATQGDVVVLGRAAPSVVNAVEQAAHAARLRARVEVDVRGAAARLLAGGRHPLAVVCDATSTEGRDACLAIRHEPQLANVPIMALIDGFNDLAFEELYEWGGDDLVPRGDAAALARRLRQVATNAVPLARRAGTAVVADPDRRTRLLTGRALRNTGLSVLFAVDAAEALREAARPELVVVVQATDLDPPQGPTLAEQARNAGIATPWVITSPPRRAAQVRARIASLPKVTVHDAFGAPENVLFVINELVRGGVAEGRASKRLLYGTTLLFRHAGGEKDEAGFTFNISAGGLFARTLAPPSRNAELWLELRPPRSDRRVRLEGRVVWARAFGPNDAATVPAGFAVQFAETAPADLQRFRDGYGAFAAEVS
jgi:CheY-like chemotaxis protein